jgi:hypothetical protein
MSCVVALALARPTVRIAAGAILAVLVGQIIAGWFLLLPVKEGKT